MFKSLFSLVLLVGMAFFGAQWYLATKTQQQVIDTVIKTERVVSSDGSEGKYIIFGESETYQDTDSILNNKFNSSDIYGHIVTGGKYKFTVTGYRVPFLSYYRNIIKAELVPEVK